MSEVQPKNMIAGDFPGNADAGKLLQWISRQISATRLGANVLMGGQLASGHNLSNDGILIVKKEFQLWVLQCTRKSGLVS
ncbi:hypothetical protein [Pseudomonas sp. R45(2017)]|uniref:hypothetical protein n=1 Tax=Pseudomonas sp. R45(2017) TaxID=1981678 RepID=UPI000A1EC87B|nr:hypothetical protein [Pseudomonas sp. R45(2017)]